ncbi:glycoside hydrolase family 32 protein [Paenibacillus shenyangensis]|uniref:glycoside hydrolase family 32 protein n=1 Tax=Paenibacillus sp. A9 TaxID=1284352 RepID=UPI0003775F0F|nr:glycoside hydrolase family 32 protein [Paenibacillus sp. A9]
MSTLHSIQQAAEALQLSGQKINPQYRPGYHIAAPANWINDPNGLVQFNGEYHVFYQHHPYDENWGPMHWGHVKSSDLVHWEHCPIALAPGDDCDRDGCFSGSAVDDNGVMTLIYTGHHYTDRDKDLFTQNQNIAVSHDGITFEKYESNPVIAEPPADSAHHFRDPKVWKHNDTWYMVLGNATPDGHGRVILYHSSDLRAWTYSGVLAASDGTLGFMWECPDFFELDGRYVLLFSPQGMEREEERYLNLFQTGYLVGDYDYASNDFRHGEFREMDHGHDFYAVQTLLDNKGRRIAIGWMDMWESDMPTKAHGWAGALTLPRVLNLDEDGRLLMNPVEEIKLLRREQYRLGESFTVTERRHETVTESLLEILVVFDLNNSQSNKVGLTLYSGAVDKTVITYDIAEGKLTLDASKSGKPQDGIRMAPLQHDGLLTLRLFLDRSSIEVFANEGRATLTSRIYPTGAMTGIELFAAGGKTDVKEWTCWTLEDVWNSVYNMNEDDK